MASGNFLIAERVSYDEFRQYVLPELQKRDLSVPDSVQVPLDMNPANASDLHESSVLVSIIGEGNLETAVDEALVAVANLVDEEAKAAHLPDSQAILSAHRYARIKWAAGEGGQGEEHRQAGNYKVLGTYNDDEKASELFAGLANQYFAEATKKTVDETARRLRAMGEKLSRA